MRFKTCKSKMYKHSRGSESFYVISSGIILFEGRLWLKLDAVNGRAISLQKKKICPHSDMSLQRSGGFLAILGPHLCKFQENNLSICSTWASVAWDDIATYLLGIISSHFPNTSSAPVTLVLVFSWVPQMYSLLKDFALDASSGWILSQYTAAGLTA